MKLSKCLLIAIAVLSLCYAPAANAQGALPVCAVMSWSPEIFTFYGDAPTVLKKLQSVDRDLLKHRVFAFIVETKQGAHLSLFELESTNQLATADTMQLASMRGASFDDLTHQITTTLLNNDGQKCAGRLAHDLINQYGNGQLQLTTVSRPANMSEAFKEASELADGGYIRATFILLC